MNMPLGQDLGERIEVFKPGMANVAAGVIIAVLLTALGGWLTISGITSLMNAGANLPLTAERGSSWMSLGFMSVSGIGLLLGSLGLLWYVKWLWSHQVEWFSNGFRYWSRGMAQEVPWSTVSLVREVVVYERPPILKGAAKLLMPKTKSRSYTVSASSDKVFIFDGDSVKRIKRLGTLLREKATSANTPWETEEINA